MSALIFTVLLKTLDQIWTIHSTCQACMYCVMYVGYRNAVTGANHPPTTKFLDLGLFHFGAADIVRWRAGVNLGQRLACVGQQARGPAIPVC